MWWDFQLARLTSLMLLGSKLAEHSLGLFPRLLSLLDKHDRPGCGVGASTVADPLKDLVMSPVM